jgi:hypothetical protein
MDFGERVHESVFADRMLWVLVHAQLEHVGTRVVAGNVEVVLPPWDVVEFEFGVVSPQPGRADLLGHRS